MTGCVYIMRPILGQASAQSVFGLKGSKKRTQFRAFKGIVDKNILGLNLIFWDMMGCGIDHFGRRGLETTNSDKIWSKILFPGVSTHGSTETPRHRESKPLAKMS